MNDEASAAVGGAIRVEGNVVGSALIVGNGNVVRIVYASDVLRARQPLAANPYRGLDAFDETSSDFFFGRERLVGTLLARLERLTSPAMGATRLLAIIGPSGCGKSSVARAGLLPALARAEASWLRGAQVAILRPGYAPIEALADALARLATGEPNPSETRREFATLLREGARSGSHAGLSEIARAYLGSVAPVVVLVDQFEETYTLSRPIDPDNKEQVQAAKAERDDFVGTLLQAATEPGGPVSVLITLRSDFFGALAEQAELSKAVAASHELVPAMSRDDLRRAVAEPARVKETPLDPATVERILDQAAGEVAALPLVEFALEQIWERMRDGVAPADTLTSLGGVGGALASRADEVLGSLASTEQRLAEQAFLATVQLGDVAVRDTRRRAWLDEVVPTGMTQEDIRRTVEPFVKARLLAVGASDDDRVWLELPHEALIRHWQTFQQWLNRDREFLLWRKRLREAREEWQTYREQGKNPQGALLRGARLAEAEHWLQDRRTLTDDEGHFIRQSAKARTRRKTFAAGIVMLVLLSIGFVSWYRNNQLSPQMLVWLLRAPFGYTPQLQMVDVPAGSFLMGSPASDEPHPQAEPNEWPQHQVIVHKPFRIGKFEVTFDEYDFFVHLTCRRLPDHNGWGRGHQPVINVTWDDAQAYVAWLRKRTGKRYRLPTEAEWEYATRAGTTTQYWWGDEVPAGRQANCGECGNQWSNKRTAPVGALLANLWGLHDTAGNVWEWVQDCRHENYEGAPSESGNAWEDADGKCRMRMVRGGAWNAETWFTRSAGRREVLSDYQVASLGFRLVQDLD
jgi:formylglycine-generating enzyme required for sulfatase activity